MALNLRPWSPLAAAVAVLSCTSEPVDPLEALARDGDPVAACQLASRMLHKCALEKQKWENDNLSERPACIDNAISDKVEGYLDAARDELDDDAASAMIFQVQKLLLLGIQTTFSMVPADKMIESTARLEQGCTEMAKLLKA